VEAVVTTPSLDVTRRSYLSQDKISLVNIIEYEQVLRDGQLTTLPGPDQVFWPKVGIIDDDASCWEFLKATRKRPKGNYGVVSMINPATGRKGTVNAQRVAFYLVHGYMPTVGRHDCDNPPCCRPSHIRDGTIAENNRDKAIRRRVLGVGGQDALTPELVRRARILYRNGMSAPKIAAELDRKLDAIQLALSGKSWKWITDPPPIAVHERRMSGGKLTAPQAAEIRRLRTEGKSVTELGLQFGVHHSNISIICRDMPGVRAIRSGSKFTNDQIREIRRLGAAGMKRAVLAEQFGIKSAALSNILGRRSYAHVTDQEES
jgi:hypothetical protein